jgi:AcrR family transcriptional regulator
MQGKREAQAARRREILLETAFRLFSERGYRKTAVRDITRESGVTEAVLYHYFTNKADLLSAVVARYAPFARYREIIDEQSDAPVDEVLQRLGSEFLALLFERRSFVLGLLSEAPNNPEVGAILGGFLGETVQRVSEYLRRRQELGHLSADIDVVAAARALQGGLLLQFLSRSLLDSSRPPTSGAASADDLVSVLMSGILPDRTGDRTSAAR